MTVSCFTIYKFAYNLLCLVDCFIDQCFSWWNNWKFELCKVPSNSIKCSNNARLLSFYAKVSQCWQNTIPNSRLYYSWRKFHQYIWLTVPQSDKITAPFCRLTPTGPTWFAMIEEMCEARPVTIPYIAIIWNATDDLKRAFAAFAKETNVRTILVDLERREANRRIPSRYRDQDIYVFTRCARFNERPARVPRVNVAIHHRARRIDLRVAIIANSRAENGSRLPETSRHDPNWKPLIQIQV